MKNLAGLDETAALTLSGQIEVTLGGTRQDNYAPAGISGATSILFLLSADATVTGIALGGVPRAVTLVNRAINSNTLTLKARDSNSLATNWFGIAADLVLRPGEAAIFVWAGAGASDNPGLRCVGVYQDNGSRYDAAGAAAAALAAALAADITYTDVGIVITGGAIGGVALNTTVAQESRGISPAAYAYPTGGATWLLWVYPTPASGTFTLDVRKRAFGNQAPAIGDSVCAAANPSLAGNATDFTASGSLSTWTGSPLAKTNMLTVVPTVNTAGVQWYALFIPARRSL